MLQHVARFARLLPGHNGLRAAIVSENRPEWIYVLYALWHCHGIPVLFDFTSSDDECRTILEQARPDVIFCSAQYEARVRSLLGASSCAPALLVFEHVTETNEVPAIDRVTWSDIDATALIVFTSGTTGAQKGACLSFRNLLSNIEPVLEFATPKDATLLLLPLYHIFPLLWTVIAPMYFGICTVISPSLEPAAILSTLRQHPVSAIIGVPALYERIHKTIFEKIHGSFWARRALGAARFIGSPGVSRLLFRRVHAQFGGCVKYLICGGAALDVKIQRDFLALGFPFYTGYGLTETSPMVSFNKPGHVRLGSVGLPIPKTSVRIVEGEITIRGENVMQGYDDAPEETRDVMRDGWLFTGDLGHIDPDGYVFITGRKKEIIVLPSGKNINPEDVESRLLSFSDVVDDAAVYEKEGRLAALIVSASDAGIVREHVIHAYNRTVPSHRRIFSVIVTRDTLPKTSLGKLKRHALPAYADARSSASAEGGDEARRESSPLLRYIRKIRKPTAASTDNIVLDLGLDSLDLVVLRAYIESNYGITLTADDLLRHQTIGELWAYIRRHSDARHEGEEDWRSMFDGVEEMPIPRTWLTIDLWQWMLRFAYRFMLHVTIEGRASIPSPPVLFVANHQSSLDPFLVTAFLPNRQFRSTFYLAKDFHYRARWKQWIVDRHNVVRVLPNEQLAPALRTLARCLEAEKNVLIFPEGTRSTDGLLTDFKRAFALLSCALQVPVVPVVINGTLDTLPKGKLWPKYGVPVSVRFLEAVSPDGHTPASLTAEIQSIMEDEIEQHSPLTPSASGM